MLLEDTRLSEKVSRTRCLARVPVNHFSAAPCTQNKQTRDKTFSTQTTQSLPIRRDSMQHTDFSNRQEAHAAWIDAWKTHHDTKALQRLIDDYQLLFRKKIRQIMQGRTLSPNHQADLEQECVFAFIRAIDKYDASKSPVFSAYVVRYIKGSLQRYILDFRAAYKLGTGPRERTVYYAAQKLRAQRLAEGFSQLNEADVQLLASQTQTDIDTSRRAVMSLQGKAVELDNLSFEEESQDTANTSIDQNAMAAGMAAFERACLELPERSRRVICETMLGHQHDTAFERLAAEFNLTERRVRQIQVEALATLRRIMEQNSVTADCIF